MEKSRTPRPVAEGGAKASLGSPPEKTLPKKSPPSSSPPLEGLGCSTAVSVPLTPLLQNAEKSQVAKVSWSAGKGGLVEGGATVSWLVSAAKQREDLLFSPVLLDAVQFSDGCSFGKKGVFRENKKIAACEELQSAFPRSGFYLTSSGRALLFGVISRGQIRVRVNGHNLLRLLRGLPTPEIEGPKNQFTEEERALLWKEQGEQENVDLIAPALGKLDELLQKLASNFQEVIAKEFPDAKANVYRLSSVIYKCEFGFEIGPYPEAVLSEIQKLAERAVRAQGGVVTSIQEWIKPGVRVNRLRIENPNFLSGDGEETFLKIYIKRNCVRIEVVFDYPQASKDHYGSLMDRLAALAFWARRKLDSVKHRMQDEFYIPQVVGPEDIERILKVYGFKDFLAWNLRWQQFEQHISCYGVYTPAELKPKLRIPATARKRLSDPELGVLEEKRHLPSSGHGAHPYYLLRHDWRSQVAKYKEQVHGGI